jgi:hypothetical protein
VGNRATKFGMGFSHLSASEPAKHQEVRKKFYFLCFLEGVGGLFDPEPP